MRAAERLLASSDSGQISTRDICAGAGVTAPTLYHHFTDKDALLDAVVLEGFTSYLEGKRAVARTGDALHDFRAGWDMHVSFGCEHPASYRLMFGNPQPDRMAPAAAVARDEVARTVADWGAAGKLKVSVDAATQTMSAAAVGVTMQLIAAKADSTHAISTNVRDAVAGALFHAPEPDTAGDNGWVRPARQLLHALAFDSAVPLRPTEAALLREWLTTLGDAAAGRDTNRPRN